MVVDERSLLDATGHLFLTRIAVERLLLAAAAHDELVRGLVVTGPVALGGNTPGRAGMATARGATLATTHRVIDGVHRDAAIVGAASEPADAAGLAPGDVGVLAVADAAD